MINLNSITTDELGFEQILVSGEVNIGNVDSIFLLILKSELDPSDITVYDNFISENSDGQIINIDGTLCQFSMDRITSLVIPEGLINVDVNSVPQARKDSIVAFCDLVDRLILAQI